ncbi:PGF-pre-PGF domain-containing protein [Candidatus Woesearchaeota archaeon]|nr:MAG: PGF-pre-PGF domain-containing protein [Candidatus Woesearchaeota archaeon]
MRKHLFFFLLFLILPSVSAQFQAFGDISVNAPICGATQRNLTIANTGSERATYSISVDGSASQFVKFSAINFALDAGKKALVETYYEIPCDTEPGKYPLNIYFSDGIQELVLPQEVSAEHQLSLIATASKTSKVITPCESAEYEIKISNPAEFTEIYKISTQGREDATTSHKEIVLEAGQSKNIKVKAEPQDCTEHGTSLINTTIKTEKTKQEASIPFELIIRPTNIPEISPEISEIRTNHEHSSAELSIKNIGDETTTYEMSVEGPGWVSITPTTTTLEPGESTTITLVLEPSENEPEGKYALTVLATVQSSSIVYEKPLKLILKEPGWIETHPAATALIAFATILLLALLILLIRFIRGPKFASIRTKAKKKIEAIGARRKARKEAKEKARQRAKERRLKEQEREKARKEKLEAKLARKVEREFKKNYHLVLRKEAIRGRKSKKSILIAIFILIIAALYAALYSILSANTNAILTGLAVLVALWLAKRITETKKITCKSRFLVEPEVFALWSRGISSITASSETAIKNLKLTVRKVKPHLKPSSAVYKAFSIRANAKTELSATITVSKKWLERNNASEEDVKLSIATGKFRTVPLVKIGEDDATITYETNLPGQGTYIIHAKRKTKPSKKKLIISSIAVIAVSLVLSAALIPQSAPRGLIPNQEWKKNTVHTIDLSPYFTDPDGDTLTYSAVGGKNINIKMSGSKAILTPKENFIGDEVVRFTASDGKGGISKSNPVVLSVKNSIPPFWLSPALSILFALIAILTLVSLIIKLHKK